MKTLLLILVLSAMVVGSAWVQWWRCGEMFPHAQMACFVGGGDNK